MLVTSGSGNITPECQLYMVVGIHVYVWFEKNQPTNQKPTFRCDDLFVPKYSGMGPHHHP